MTFERHVRLLTLAMHGDSLAIAALPGDGLRWPPGTAVEFYGGPLDGRVERFPDPWEIHLRDVAAGTEVYDPGKARDATPLREVQSGPHRYLRTDFSTTDGEVVFRHESVDFPNESDS